MTEFVLEMDGARFKPVPRSWIDAGRDLGENGPRVYAVSTAVVRGGSTLLIRYAHPRQFIVIRTIESAVENSNQSGYIPKRLANSGRDWPRSLVPPPDTEDDGVMRAAEFEHFDELWRNRLDLNQMAVADGGVWNA